MTSDEKISIEPILDLLNEDQRRAVTACTSTPLQIKAGPGTGKTKVLVARVAYLLLKHRIPPQNIIVTTFTKKAAKEMIERLDKLLQGSGIPTNKLLIGTFHSISYRIIQKYGAAEGLTGFTVATEKDAAQILENVLDSDISDKDWALIQSLPDAALAPFVAGVVESDDSGDTDCGARPKLDKKKILRQISKLKAHAIFADEYAKQRDSKFLLSLIYSLYQRRLFDNRLLDFDDCLLYCHKIISRRPVLNFVQHTLVDEFQDTNEIQLQLMFEFAKVKKVESGAKCSVTIVGDLDQSIYAFRDAQVGNFEKMLDHFSRIHSLQCMVVTLSQNYRSTSDILAFSEHVMRQQMKRTQKNLVSQLQSSLKPVRATLESLDEEARWAAYHITHLVSLPQSPFEHSDIAVLVRSAYQTRVLESEFVKHRVPYTIVKGRAFWERKEVLAMVDYLRCVANENDQLAYLRCINYPKRGFGPVAITEIEKLFSQTAKPSTDIREQIRLKLSDSPQLNASLALQTLRSVSRKELKSSFGAKLLESLKKFIAVIDETRKLVKEAPNGTDSNPEALAAAFDYLYETSGLKREMGDDENKRLNIEEVKAQLILFEKPAEEDSLPDFVEHQVGIPDSEVIGDSEEEDEVIELLNISGEQTKGKTYDTFEFLRSFLSLVVLYETENSSKDHINHPKVSISTIHGAKGLEWPVVFIPGLGEGLLPASFALDGTEDAINEERRCFYVASTRAKTLLYLSTYTEKAGSLNWGRKPVEKQSRFLTGLDPMLAQMPFENEQSMKKLYTLTGTKPPQDLDYEKLQKKYLRDYNLYVKQTTDDHDNRPGFVTGTDISKLTLLQKATKSAKRLAPHDNKAPKYVPKRATCAPFKPVVRLAPVENHIQTAKATAPTICTNSTAALNTTSTNILRAPAYIPARAKHKRRLGTR